MQENLSTIFPRDFDAAKAPAHLHAAICASEDVCLHYSRVTGPAAPEHLRTSGASKHLYQPRMYNPPNVQELVACHLLSCDKPVYH